ncbi:nuclear transport factor 2 family protein [Solirubrobacter soli]|uniref:nuclear transport factor 2 family protein n=1 Tax=Solirubrobacter soli TaxID=363832 RepID=UPI000403D2A8|nr:nuclear transport factor 2 family protein [Solirubrobacter soli]
MTTTTSSATADLAVVGALFDAFARGDLATFAERLAPDATWNHRNDDRLGGVHHGRDGIMAFLGESGQLTAGTLRAVPETLMADGEGRVAAVMRVSGRRPDGRAFDDQQMLLCVIDGDRIRSFDQYIGDPGEVTAFWA